MNDEPLVQRVLHLSHVEKLSQRQISETLNISRRRVKGIIGSSGKIPPIPRKSALDEYVHIIKHWYNQYPKLKALQIYERLKSYGYNGSYAPVVRLTRDYRTAKTDSYHTLTFLPGEEAQVDWFFFNHENIGQVAGFVYILSYSRYAWGIFYPRTSFEFFLAGHVESFKHIGGLAHRHRYDNLKSVVIKRSPEIEYNPQFMDFARFFGFSIHACNPYSGNEKGRVERLIRDIRSFLYGKTFTDINDLNKEFHLWLTKRNETIHRSTNITPKDLLVKERLIKLPNNPYPTNRVIQALVSKTALIEFDSNRYSVPSTCSGKAVDIIAYPDHIEIVLSGKKVAIHKRSFNKKETIQNPLHSEKLLNMTPAFKMGRILQLISNTDPAFRDFLDNQADETERMNAAYQLFTLLRTHSKSMVISAVKDLIGLSCFKTKALMSLLNLPEPKVPEQLWPNNADLLNLKYQERSLNDYDPDSRDVEKS